MKTSKIEFAIILAALILVQVLVVLLCMYDNTLSTSVHVMLCVGTFFCVGVSVRQLERALDKSFEVPKEE